jgi:hypothetical protein
MRTWPPLSLATDQVTVSPQRRERGGNPIDLTERENPKRDLQTCAFTHQVEAYDALKWLGRFVERSIDGWPGVSANVAARRAPGAEAPSVPAEAIPSTGTTTG